MYSTKPRVTCCHSNKLEQAVLPLRKKPPPLLLSHKQPTIIKVLIATSLNARILATTSQLLVVVTVMKKGKEWDFVNQKEWRVFMQFWMWEWCRQQQKRQWKSREEDLWLASRRYLCQSLLLSSISMRAITKPYLNLLTYWFKNTILLIDSNRFNNNSRSLCLSNKNSCCNTRCNNSSSSNFRVSSLLKCSRLVRWSPGSFIRRRKRFSC